MKQFIAITLGLIVVSLFFLLILLKNFSIDWRLFYFLDENQTNTRIYANIDNLADCKELADQKLQDDERKSVSFFCGNNCGAYINDPISSCKKGVLAKCYEKQCEYHDNIKFWYDYVLLSE